MYQQLIGACYLIRCKWLFGLNILVGDGLAVIFERRGNEPAVLVLEQLVHTHLMSLIILLGIIAEAGVIDEIGATIRRVDHGVVALRALALRHESPVAIGAEQFLAASGSTLAEVQFIVGIDSIAPTTIGVGSVRILRTEHAHLVAALLIQATIAHKQVVVATNIFYIGTLARYIVAASYTLAEIGVAVACRVGHVIVSQTRLLIQFQHEDTSTP